MRDFRFHVASLMAVFLALGVGIIVGYEVALSVGLDPLRMQIDTIRRHDAAVEQENRQVQKDNDRLKNERDRIRSQANHLAMLSISGRLSGRTVSLVAVGPPPGARLVDSVWNALLLAGARRLNETVIRGALSPPRPDDLQEMLTRIGAPQDRPANEALTDAVGHSISTGSDPTLIPDLSHRGAPIDPSGAYDRKPDLVVLLSQIDSPQRLEAVRRGNTQETALVRLFQAQGIRVVECERSFAADSGASYFRRLGLSTVDDVETVEGQVALVWSALGYSGHFGRKPGADALLPGEPRP